MDLKENKGKVHRKGLKKEGETEKNVIKKLKVLKIKFGL